MSSIYRVGMNRQFSIEFENYPEYQQDKILDFVNLFKKFGLSDFSKYDGKIAPSWSSLKSSNPDYIYAKANNLWHYHIGIPIYQQVHSKYKTSDVVLHFQWRSGENVIYLVDIYNHYKHDGSFYLPSFNYLAQ